MESAVLEVILVLYEALIERHRGASRFGQGDALGQ